MRERRNISTRTRFEVIKRDKFTCQYCGAKAPHVSQALRRLSSEYVSQALREHLTHDLGVAEMVSVLDRIVVLTDRTIGRIVMADMEAERGAAI